MSKVKTLTQELESWFIALVQSLPGYNQYKHVPAPTYYGGTMFSYGHNILTPFGVLTLRLEVDEGRKRGNTSVTVYARFAEPEKVTDSWALFHNGNPFYTASHECFSFSRCNGKANMHFPDNVEAESIKSTIFHQLESVLGINLDSVHLT